MRVRERCNGRVWDLCHVHFVVIYSVRCCSSDTSTAGRHPLHCSAFASDASADRVSVDLGKVGCRWDRLGGGTERGGGLTGGFTWWELWQQGHALVPAIASHRVVITRWSAHPDRVQSVRTLGTLLFQQPYMDRSVLSVRCLCRVLEGVLE